MSIIKKYLKSFNRELIVNMLIYGIGNCLKSIIPIALLPILTSKLSVKEFGVLSIVEVSILFISPLIIFNINGAINVEYFKISRENLKQYIGNSLRVSFISFIVISAIFIPFKSVFAKSLNIPENLIMLLPLFSALRVVSAVVLGLYQSMGKAMSFTLFTLVQTIIDIALSYILVVLFNLGIIGRLEGVYIAFFISTVYGIYILKKFDLLGSLFTTTYTKDILRFCAPLLPHAIGGTVLAMSDRYFITYFIGIEHVGYYAISYQVASLMLLVGTSVNQAWIPILFKLLKEKMPIKVLYKYTLYVGLMFISLGLLIFLFSDVLFFIFVKKKFFLAKEYFPILLLGFVFQSLYFLFANFFFYAKKTKILASITFSGALFNLTITYFFVKHFGVIGVAWASTITWIMFFAFTAFFSLKLNHYDDVVDIQS
jgi:O-antigen/teichoic acid export membrane protein